MTTQSTTPQSTTICPCGSGRNLDGCCGAFIAGAPAPTAEALMRSRYTAFALGETDYLVATLAPAIRAGFDPGETGDTLGDTKWQGLEILAVGDGGEDDESGTVEFVARFSHGGQARVHHEVAEFRRQEGRWMCVGGTMDPKGRPREVVKIGRNERCPCGSGKKYKKCCGA
ncbi:MAG: YchJ family protein [Alphaproteobacteria bacterium]